MNTRRISIKFLQITAVASLVAGCAESPFTAPKHDDLSRIGDGAVVPPAAELNGGKIVFTSDRDGNFEIYVVALDGSLLRRLTNDDYLQ